MGQITGTINHGVVLSTSGSYTSPLTVTASGYVNAAGLYAIYGSTTFSAGTVVNEGRIHNSNGFGSDVILEDGGYISNSGTVTGSNVTGLVVYNAVGTVVNSGLVHDHIGVIIRNGARSSILERLSATIAASISTLPRLPIC